MDTFEIHMFFLNDVDAGKYGYSRLDLPYNSCSDRVTSGPHPAMEYQSDTSTHRLKATTLATIV